MRQDNPGRTLQDTNAISGRGMITEDADGTLKAPDNIIITVSCANTYYTNARQAHVERIKLYAALKGLIEGDAPYDAEELSKAGLSHITNVNLLDGKSQFKRTALTFWNLINQNSNLVKFIIRKYKGQEDQNYTSWAEIMSRNFTDVVKEMWPNFITEYNTMVSQLVQLGLSPVVFKHEKDFRWESIDLSRTFFADKTLTNSDNWDYVCIETPYNMQYLWGVYDQLKKLNAEKRKEAPWDFEALGEYILQKANNVVKSSSTNSNFPNMLDLQTAMQANDVNRTAVFSDQVSLVSLFYKEYSGKVSHYIFDPFFNESGEDFLFTIPEQFNNFNEVLICPTYEPGQRYLHEVRGQGHMIYPACQAMMQSDGHMFDMIKLAATPIIESQSTMGRDINPIRFIPGVATDIGAAKLAQNNIGSNVGQIVQGSQYLERKINRNSQISGDDPSIPDGDRGSKSAPEIQMQSMKEFGVGKQVVAHFYSYFDLIIKQMVTKMYHSQNMDPGYEIVEEWRERCIGEGVPEEILVKGDAKPGMLPKYLTVRASRVAGDGSNLGLNTGLRSVAPIVGRLSEKGQYNYTYDVINGALGADYTERYMVDMQEPDEAGGGASVAMLENIAIKMGEKPQAARENQQKAHLGSHFALISEMIKLVQAQEMDPIAADKIFSLAIPHAKEHIDFLSEDSLNQGFIEQITEPFRQMFKFAQLNRVKAQNMQKAEVRRREQEQQALSAEQIKQQREDFKAQKEDQRADIKITQQIERSKEANQTRAEIMKKGVESKADNERLAVTLKAENEKIKNNKVVGTPKQIMEGTTTDDLQNSLRSQIGNTPNPADFE